MVAKDYYNVLGVPREATAQQIKQAYRKLAVQYHPDKNPDPEARPRMREINEAYDVLSDEEKRNRYDQRLDYPYTWEDIVTPAEPAPPGHQDPRYRRRRPAAARPYAREPGEAELLKPYLVYVRAICYVGVTITLLLVLDRIIPSRVVEDDITHIRTITGRRDSYSYDRVYTADGRSLTIYDREAYKFRDDPHVIIHLTPVYGIPLRVTNQDGTKTARLGYLFRSLVFIPVILFISSLLGILMRKDVHFIFSLGVVSAFLLILNLYLILR